MGILAIFIMKHCPKCGSIRTSINENSEFYCKRCGFINSKIKKACFIDFKEISSSLP